MQFCSFNGNVLFVGVTNAYRSETPAKAPGAWLGARDVGNLLPIRFRFVIFVGFIAIGEAIVSRQGVQRVGGRGF